MRIWQKNIFIYFYFSLFGEFWQKKTIDGSQKNEIKITKHFYNHWFFEIIRIIGFLNSD
jgi:hypothetical protein